MDANRDEALKCIAIAKGALQNDDIAKAMKFLTKAQSMYPTNEANELLKSCSSRSTKTSKAEQPRESNGPSNNMNGSSGSREAADGARSNTKTSALNRECIQILSCRSYYDVLGVPRSASDDEIKRAYKKLALKFHPDKNPARRAGEAFNKISEAFQCLSDRKTRDHYDRFGREPGPAADRGHHMYQQGMYMTPDQLFEALFRMSTSRGQFNQNAGPNHAHQHRGYKNSDRASAATHTHHQEHPFSPFFLVPLLLLLLVMFVSNFMGSEKPVFQYHSNGPYKQMQSTRLNGVVYYVDGSMFEKNYPEKTKNRVRLEYEVDYNFFESKCSVEKTDNHKKAYDYISHMKAPPKELYETPQSCQILGGLRQKYEEYLRSGAYRH